jgi:predicted Rossmann-fold nucleotide-binding protein
MTRQISLALFASEKGHGDAERAGIMSQAGSFLAKKGVRIICAVGKEGVSVPLVKGARAAGGDALFLAGEDFKAPSALADVTVEHFATPELIRERLHALADAYVGLPGSLASITSLFETWSTGQKPVALLNRNRAFEVIRGFAVDVMADSKKNWELDLQIADNMDDLWNRLSRMIQAK